MLGSTLGAIALCLTIGFLTNSILTWAFTAVLMIVLIPMIWLTALVRRAMYKQIDGRPGAVGAALSELRGAWITSEEPVGFSREQDLVWRIVGRPGVVLISEGPTTRVRGMLEDEAKKAQRVVSTVPVHQIQVGNDEGQVPLIKLRSALRRLPKALNREDVPSVSKRLKALEAKGLPIPKGIDPAKVRPSRRAQRG